MTRDELIDLISDVTTLLGSALARHVELTENISAGAGVESQKIKIEKLKARMVGEEKRLQKLKGAARRKRELEKLRKGSSGRPQVDRLRG